MKEQMKSFKILISHASDVKKELDSIAKSVKRFNDLFSDFLKLTLKTCTWEDNLCPVSAYTRPQEGVNEQLVNSSDMCIAIFRTRFGLPRGGVNKDGKPYGSGTEEEIALFSEQGKPVLVYFLDEECITMNSLDMKQYEQLRAFKEDYEKKYMYSLYNDEGDTYKTESDLEFQVFNHLCNYFIKDKEFIKSNNNDALLLNLIGGFSKDNPNDKEVLKHFLQFSDDQFLSLIERIEIDINSKDDKSSYKMPKNDITIADRINFWRLNGCEYNDISIFERFKELAQQVLSNSNNYSPCLLKGICESLALMQNQSDVFLNINSTNKIISIADNVVSSLFFEYNNDEKCKSAFKRLIENCDTKSMLSILAEAAPEIFLRAIDSANKFDDFKYDIHLLWAMERLAWDNRYLVHVCAALYDLSFHDSVGFIGNDDSPIHSIITILKSVCVFANERQKKWDEKKIAAINLIKERNSDFAVSIIKYLLFDNSFMFSTRDINGNAVPSTFPEFINFEIDYEYPKFVSNRAYNAYIELALSISKENLNCLKMLIESFNDCSEPLINLILNLMNSNFRIDFLDDYNRYEIWGLLKLFIVNNRHFKNEGWAKSDECLRNAEKCLNKYIPQSKLYIAAWYFINFDISEEPWNESNYDFNAEDRVRLELRLHQLNELIDLEGLESVVRLFEFCNKNANFDIYSFAYTLSVLDKSELDNLLFDKYLLSNDGFRFIRSYIGYRFCDEKSAFCFLDDCKHWSQRQICIFLSSMPFNIDSEKLTALLTEKENVKFYWQNINVITSKDSVLKEYFSNGRYELLFRCFCSYENVIDTGFIIEVLNNIFQSDNLPVNSSIVFNQLERILKNQTVTVEVKEELEWQYIKFYKPYGHAFSPIHLFEKINSNKKYLCEIIIDACKLSSQCKKGQSTYLLWLWSPDFNKISNLSMWYSDINKELSDKASKYFQKYLGRKLYEPFKQSLNVSSDTHILSVLDSSSIMSSAFSDVACGIGDLDDLRLYVHEEGFYKQLTKQAPFWQEKAEEVDNLGYYNLATAFRALAKYMTEDPLLCN